MAYIDNYSYEEPERAERGAIVEALYVAQARQIAKMYNALAERERRPDLEE